MKNVQETTYIDLWGVTASGIPLVVLVWDEKCDQSRQMLTDFCSVADLFSPQARFKELHSNYFATINFYKIRSLPALIVVRKDGKVRISEGVKNINEIMLQIRKFLPNVIDLRLSDSNMKQHDFNAAAGNRDVPRRGEKLGAESERAVIVCGTPFLRKEVSLAERGNTYRPWEKRHVLRDDVKTPSDLSAAPHVSKPKESPESLSERDRLRYLIGVIAISVVLWALKDEPIVGFNLGISSLFYGFMVSLMLGAFFSNLRKFIFSLGIVSSIIFSLFFSTFNSPEKNRPVPSRLEEQWDTYYEAMEEFHDYTSD
jgi:hypothetical protein